jgi:hypothetical protein
LFAFYARADAAAIHDQRCTQRRLKLLFGLGWAAVLCIEGYAHLFHSFRWLAGYAAFVLGAFGVHGHSRWRRHQRRYLDHRALAEALRVQFFWHSGGLSESVADHYLRQFRSELDWIRQALRTCQMMSGAHGGGAAGPVAADPALVLKRWIQDQRAYFAKQGHARGEDHRKHEVTSGLFFAAGVLSALLLLAVHWRTGEVSHGLLVAMFLVLVASASFHEWTEKSGDGVDAHRYEWAASVFEAAEQRWLETADPDVRRPLLRELGREALTENADWVVQHRQRPLTVVKF